MNKKLKTFLIFVVLISVGLFFVERFLFIAEPENWPISETPPGGGMLLVKYKQEGGTAGHCDTTLINTDGDVIIEDSCNNTKPVSDYKVTSSEFNQLLQLSNELKSFKYKKSDPPDAIDGLTVEITFHGIGDKPATTEDKELIRGLLNTLYLSLK